MTPVPLLVLVSKSPWTPAIRREHALARAAAADGVAVIFLEAPLDVRSARRAAFWRAWLATLLRCPISAEAPGIHVITTATLVPARRHRAAARLERWRLARDLARIRGIGQATVVTSDPFLWPALMAGPGRRRVYDSTDDWARLLPTAAPRVHALCATIAADADAVISVSEAMRPVFGQRMVVIPNGVGPELLEAPWRPPPAGARGLIYTGTLSERVDAPLVAALLRHLPGWRLDLIGPCRYAGRGEAPAPELQALIQDPELEVSLLPPVGREDLAAAIDSASVALIPHRPGLSSGQDSMKLYDFAARGRPVVATPALGPLPPALADGVWIAEGPEALAAAVKAAAAAPEAVLTEMRAWAGEQSWTRRWVDWRRVVLGEETAPAPEPLAPAVPPAPAAGEVAQRAAGSAALLLIRRVLIMVLSALSTVVVARLIGVGNFGILAAATTLVALLSGVADFGFSIVLARDMAREPERAGRLMGTAVALTGVGGLLAALVLVGIGVGEGPLGRHSLALYILAIPLALAGIGEYRQAFIVAYRVGRLAVIDLATNLGQAATTILVALAGGGLIGVALCIAAFSLLNLLLVAGAGRRLVAIARPRGVDLRRFLGLALPLGLASLLSSVYFTIDLVLLPWLVSARQVGEYAAAVKFLNLLVLIPGFVVTAVLPGLAVLAEDRGARSALMARMWHWLMAVGLPACAGAAIFAAPIISVAFGPRYAAAVPMFRILACAAAVALASNVFGVTLNSLGIARWQMVQNLLAVALNIAANVVLAPRYGPVASAWITLATELFVCTGALIALRGRWHPRVLTGVSRAPAVALGVFIAIGLSLSARPALAIPAAALGYGLTLVALGGWPAEFTLHWRRGASARLGT